jgi:HK97 family phage portal protein
MTGLRNFAGRVFGKSAWETVWRRHHVYGMDEAPAGMFSNTGDYLEAYSKIGTVYACVSLIASSFARVPWHFEDALGNKVRRDDLRQMLRRPNPYLSGLELFEATVTHLELAGNAFWYLSEVDGSGIFETDTSGALITDAQGRPRPSTRPQFGRPGEIHYLEPDRVSIAKGASGAPAGYVYRAGSSDVPLEADWVIHFKYFNPLDRYWGMGVIQAAALKLETDYYSERWNRNFFKNSARPDGVLETDRTLSAAEFERLREEWRKGHLGTESSHRTAILEAGLKYKQITASQKDIDFLAGRELTREEICSMFGVPPAKIGVLRYANYANSREQDKTFWAETMEPKLARFAAKVTAELCARYDPGLELRFADVTPQDIAQQAEVAVKLANAGLRTINELRAEFKWGDPVAWGDAWWAPATRTPAGGGVPGETNESAPAGRQAMAERDHSRGPMRQAQDKRLCHIGSCETVLSRALKRLYQGQQSAVLRALRGKDGLLKALAAEDEAERLRCAREVLDGAIDWTAEAERFAVELKAAGAQEAQELAAQCCERAKASAAAALDAAVAAGLSAAEAADRVSGAYQQLKRENG